MTNRISDDERSLDSFSSEVTPVNGPDSGSSDASLDRGSAHRHAVFDKTNAVTQFLPAPHRELWLRCLDKKGRTQVKFDDADIGARETLERCGVILPTKTDDTELLAREATVRHLADVLSYFQGVVAPVGPLKGLKYTAKIEASIGPDGKKCPKFHVDNVGARLIMSMIGPGCVYVPENIVDAGDEAEFLPRVVNRSRLGTVARTTGRANDLIVPPKVGEKFEDSLVKQAREGEMLLLMGGLWQDVAPSSCGNCDACKSQEAAPSLKREDSHAEETLLAAVHRSPNMTRDQERVLLVVDLVDW